MLKNGRPDVPAGAAGSAGSTGSTGSTGSAGSAGSCGFAGGAAAFDYDKAIQPDRERPDAQPGAILRVTLDIDHWLSAGSDSETQAMIEGARVFAPLKLNSGRNVGIYGKKDSLIASGLILARVIRTC